MEQLLIIPNYHVILVHFPLALLALGTLIEVFAFLWRRSSFRQAGRWMLLIGAMAAIPTATSGLYAARQALSDEPESSWRELQNSHKFFGDARWEVLADHVRLNAGAVILFALLVVVWLGCSDRIRRKLHLVFLLLLLLGMGLLTAGAWHGGELVYRYSTGVIGAEAAAPSMAEAPSTAPATNTSMTMPTTTASETHSHNMPSLSSITHMSAPELRESAQRVLPPIQAHVILAGSVVAMALAALGLSIRQISMAPDPEGDEAVVDQQLADALSPGRALSGVQSFNVERARSSLLTGVDVAGPIVPPARFWLITVVLALLTIGAGLWTLGIFNVQEVINYLKDFNRAMIHTLLAGSIVVLTLILALLTRFAGRSKSALAIFAILLLAAVVAQVWMGILLLFDGARGPLGHFN